MAYWCRPHFVEATFLAWGHTITVSLFLITTTKQSRHDNTMLFLRFRDEISMMLITLAGLSPPRPSPPARAPWTRTPIPLPLLAYRNAAGSYLYRRQENYLYRSDYAQTRYSIIFLDSRGSRRCQEREDIIHAFRYDRPGAGYDWLTGRAILYACTLIMTLITPLSADIERARDILAAVAPSDAAPTPSVITTSPGRRLGHNAVATAWRSSSWLRMLTHLMPLPLLPRSCCVPKWIFPLSFLSCLL